MRTNSLLDNQQKPGSRKAKKTAYQLPDINEEYWNIAVLLILIATAIWHLYALSGWLNGNTLVNYFGLERPLATAISESPDILFYATYFAMGLSAIMFIVTLVTLVFYCCNEWDAYLAIRIVITCSIVSIWAFPFLHAITDLTATAFNVRDTSGFDVFQLGIDMWPMVINSAVCIVILWLNKRIYTRT